MGRRLVWCKFKDVSEQSVSSVLKPEDRASWFPSKVSRFLKKKVLSINFHRKYSVPTAYVLISAMTFIVLTGHIKQEPTWELESTSWHLPHFVCLPLYPLYAGLRWRFCCLQSYSYENSFIFFFRYIFLMLLLFSPNQDGGKVKKKKIVSFRSLWNFSVQWTVQCTYFFTNNSLNICEHFVEISLILRIWPMFLLM